MTWNTFRALHALHSMDVLLSYRAANGSLWISLAPFVMKFALFVSMNSFRLVTGRNSPVVGIDADVMQDFVLLYALVFAAWNTHSLGILVGLLKGAPKVNRWSVVIARCFYYSAFTWFRVQAGSKAVEMFQADAIAVGLAVFLFFELNGWILAYFRRDFSPVRSSLPTSLAAASLVAFRQEWANLIVPILVFRHLITPLRHAFR